MPLLKTMMKKGRTIVNPKKDLMLDETGFKTEFMEKTDLSISIVNLLAYSNLLYLFIHSALCVFNS